jgi:hypothetical protein
MRSSLLILIAGAGVIALALATGLLQPGLTHATLQSHAQRSIASCMRTAGFDPDPAAKGSDARDRALERCWSAAANDPRFERLALLDPLALIRRLRDEGFRAWRCAERSGWTRTSRIPLNAPGGYPLQLAAGNFRVGSSELERFYRDAARCSGDSLDMYRWSDGSFSTDPADGARCVRHRHGGGGTHAHGCYGATTYPKGT